MLLLEFLAGAWIGFFLLRSSQLPSSLIHSAAVASGLGFISSFWTIQSGLPTVLAWGAPSALLLFAIAAYERAGFLPNVLLRFSFLGDSSYSLYLIHLLLIDAFRLATDRLAEPHSVVTNHPSPTGFVVLLLAVTACCVVVAALLYTAVEKPTLASIKSSSIFSFLLRKARGSKHVALTDSDQAPDPSVPA